MEIRETLMAVLLKCPSCREKFKYDVSDGWPDKCPICKVDINNRRDDDDVVVPNILSFRTRTIDAVPRGIMDGSEKRAELAAAMAGVPVDEMANLKVTDLSDRRDSEVAVKPVVNAVTQQMDMIQARGGAVGFGAPNGAEYAANAHAPLIKADGQPTMAFANAGAREMRRLQSIMQPIGQAPLPLEIAGNPNYRPRA
jgi:hypothetical protein